MGELANEEQSDEISLHSHIVANEVSRLCWDYK